MKVRVLLLSNLVSKHALPIWQILHRVPCNRQKENYNFQKISGILADYGYQTIRRTDDWNGADFIAQHVTDTDILRVQLKGRFTFLKKYAGGGLLICFRDEESGGWYLYPHDRVFGLMEAYGTFAESRAWTEGGGYSFPYLSEASR